MIAERCNVTLRENENLLPAFSVPDGETEDSWLADLAVGWQAEQIKVGSTHGAERNSKWNRLLQLCAIEKTRFANPFQEI